jgi:hypothetical protein
MSANENRRKTRGEADLESSDSTTISLALSSRSPVRPAGYHVAGRAVPGPILSLDSYADGMVEHDALVGKLLKTVDDLGLTENTIVI